MAPGVPEYTGSDKFVHLHTHTVYSPLDGVQTPEQLFAACKERGWSALAVTEHGNLASMPDNYAAAKANGIKYIPACEIYFNDWEPERRRMADAGGKLKDLDPKLQERMRRNRHLTVLAKNATGVENLIKLTTQAYDTGYYYRPRIWFDKLLEYKEGLVILSGCLNGPISYALRQKEYTTPDKHGAIDYVRKFVEAFGDDYLIELQMPCIPGLDDYLVFWQLNAIANQFKLRKVLTNDAHYLNREDFILQKIMMAIDQGLTIDDPNLFHVNSDEQYFKSRADLWQTFKSNRYSEKVSDAEFHEMCDNTLWVADRCSNYKPDTSPKVPQLPNARERLTKMVVDGLKRKGKWDDTRKYMIDNKPVTYKEQAMLELGRFLDKNFESYFLITQDLVKFSIDRGWPVGPRGSVGGSLVCNLIGIHDLDPLMWGLSFDRFLSPSRGGRILNLKPE